MIFETDSNDTFFICVSELNKLFFIYLFVFINFYLYKNGLKFFFKKEI